MKNGPGLASGGALDDRRGRWGSPIDDRETTPFGSRLGCRELCGFARSGRADARRSPADLLDQPRFVVWESFDGVIAVNTGDGDAPDAFAGKLLRIRSARARTTRSGSRSATQSRRAARVQEIDRGMGTDRGAG
jgi:hypothetical protein